MAKTGFWLKGSTGKLAGATMYKDANGDTVMREVVKPKNPQTTKQMIQRILMNTVMQAYSAMKEITDHSFENVTAGAKTMSIFMKRNLDFAREKLSQMQAQGVDFYDMFNFCPLGTKQFVPNQYLVSTGSLPQVFCEFNTNMANDIVVPALKTNTYQGVCDALGAQRGDQITFLFFSMKSGISLFRFCRVILDPTNADGSQAAMSSAFLDGNAINLPSVRNEGTTGIVFTLNPSYGLGLHPTNAAVYAGGVILSRNLNDSWLRSTCRLIYNESVGGTYKSMGECLDAAISGNNIYSPSEWYLNNAGQGNSSAVEAGDSAPSGDGGSGSGTSGGGNTNTNSIQSVTIGGANIIAGTPRSTELGANLIVTFSGAGDSVSIFDATDLQNSIDADDPDNGSVTFAITQAKGYQEGHTYRIYVGSSYSNYSFQILTNYDDPEG